MDRPNRHEVHVHLHLPDEFVVFFSDLGRKVDQIGRKVDAISRETRQTGTLDDKLDELSASVEAETETDASVIALLTGLTQQIVDLRNELSNAGATPEQLAKLDALIAANNAKRAELADAVLANTPAAPTP